MNGVSKRIFLRFGHVALVALLALCAASAPASADGAAVAINPDGSVNSGVATVTGTLSAPAGTPVRVQIQVVQFRHGQTFASAFADLGLIIADGSTQTWTATMFSAAGFKTGQAQVTVRLFGEGEDDSVLLASAGATVQLHPH